MPHDTMWRDLHRVDVWELLAPPRSGTVLQRRRLLGRFQRENQEQLLGMLAGYEKIMLASESFNAPHVCDNRSSFRVLKQASSKAATSEDRRRTLWGTLSI